MQMDELVYTQPRHPLRRIRVVQNDICHEAVDAIVNIANPDLVGGGGVNTAINRAGGPEILKACIALRRTRSPLERSEAVATTAGTLHAKHLIHTAGPLWQRGEHGEADHLRECYSEALRLAAQLDARSIAIPSISTGRHGYPEHAAFRIAIDEMQLFLQSPICPEAFTIRFVHLTVSSCLGAIGAAHRAFGKPTNQGGVRS